MAAREPRVGGASRVNLRGHGEMADPNDLRFGEDEDQRIISEAKDRFQRAMDWEGDSRKLFNDDTKFANGDSDNGWQWPDNIKRDRDINNRPCLTVNKTKMAVLQLANEARRNPPSARVKPVGEQVSYDAAQVWEGLIRHIEYVSDAQSVYTKAKEDQLEGGIGYWQVQPDYIDDQSFDQELRVIPLDPMKTLLDCDIKRTDGSDALWGFIFDDYNRKEFEELFPDIDLPPQNAAPSITQEDDWIRKDSVRVAQYYRIKLSQEELLYIEDDKGVSWTGLKKDVPKELLELLPLYERGDMPGDYKSRKVMNRELQWFKIGGNEIIDRRDGSSIDKPGLKGRYIPIIRLPGRERVIEGKLYRAGLVRAMKDAQRMYNYNTSGEIEVVALQTKTPWVIAAEAVEGNEAAWANANRVNAAYLTWRAIADDGETTLPEPKRADPPVPAQGFLEGLRIAAAEMEMASGIYSGQVQANQQTIERTPTAIDQRTRTGEMANYDFTYNEMQAVRFTAIVLIDLLPHYYDTERVVKIKAMDQTIQEINIRPDQPTAYQEESDPAAQQMKVYFNPSIGRYAVEADVGPTYQTQRQEAWEAGKEVISGAPELMNVIGDLVFLAADWPMAEDIAERIKRNIAANSPWLLDENQSQAGPAFKQLQEQLSDTQTQLTSMQDQNTELMSKLAEAKIKEKTREEKRDIEAMDADTRRLTAEAGAVESLAAIGEGGGLKVLIRETIADMLGFTPDQIEQANAQALMEGGVGGGDEGGGGAESGTGKPAKGGKGQSGFDPATLGARQAPDGKHYMPDPSRPGKYLMVNAA